MKIIFFFVILFDDFAILSVFFKDENIIMFITHCYKVINETGSSYVLFQTFQLFYRLLNKGSFYDLWLMPKNSLSHRESWPCKDY